MKNLKTIQKRYRGRVLSSNIFVASTVYAWFNGTRTPSIEDMGRMYYELGIPLLVWVKIREIKNNLTKANLD